MAPPDLNPALPDSNRKRGRSDASPAPIRSSSRKRTKPSPPPDSPPAKPETKKSAVKPEKKKSAVKPETKKSAVKPETKKSAVKSEKKKSAVKPEDRTVEDEMYEEELMGEENGEDDDSAGDGEAVVVKRRTAAAVGKIKDGDDVEDFFVGDPIPEEEARSRWPDRYQKKKVNGASSSRIVEGDPDEQLAKRHYRQAMVDNILYNLYDCVHVKAAGDEPHYIGRIVEFFEGIDSTFQFTAQWFYRLEDTVVQRSLHTIGEKKDDEKKKKDQKTNEKIEAVDEQQKKKDEEKKKRDEKNNAKIEAEIAEIVLKLMKKPYVNEEPHRVFLSEDKNVNGLDSLVSKITIIRVEPNIDLKAKKMALSEHDYYYDMSYSTAYAAFENLPPEIGSSGSEASSNVSTLAQSNEVLASHCDPSASSTSPKDEMTLLDLYAGCGAMSTGLCLGANLARVNLVTKWAVDINKFACESLKMNHPETEVRNENAEHFLELLREWELLCRKFGLFGIEWSPSSEEISNDSDNEDQNAADDANDDIDYEVGRILDICYGDPNKTEKVGLMYRVRWKGFGPKHDSWEPAEGLSNCTESIESFVRSGFQRRILPLPGTVDVICGGPPCQGISGFNRHRNKDYPLQDPKNYQMLVYMDIVEFLKPKFVLMENVVDLLKFANGKLGRYALGRLVSLNYQASIGIMAAGCYGLPQFRMRCFLWGAHPSEKLPQYPLPTHDVVVRGGVPNEFEGVLVAYNENEKPPLEKALTLEDAISDMPPVTNAESRKEMPYDRPPKTDFQRTIRQSKEELLNSASTGKKSLSKGKLYDHKLYDHMPLTLNEDDYLRVCAIPKEKNACFRNLPGVIVGPDNKVEWDPNVELVLLPSGKQLVPNYAMSFVKGRSTKPFARLWWDETVPTVVTRAEPHNQAILHPDQDRVLTPRENARLQGFPDFYRLYGPVKQRYMQVGNAVAVPVSRALGYSMGLACQRIGGCQRLLKLPKLFPRHAVVEASSGASELMES